MAIIPYGFMEAVVSLGIVTDNNEKKWIGTGFLVGRQEANDSRKSTVYIITNRHVVQNHHTLIVRFNNQADFGVSDLPMPLYAQDNDLIPIFSTHPRENVDIVAIQINPNIVEQNNLRLSVISLEQHTLSLQQMEETGVDVGSLVYAVGFPMNFVDDEVKAPICRLGCISRIADAFAKKNEAASFLIDAQTFPGNSGGPIFSRPEIMSISGTASNSSATLIGVLSAYITYQETLISIQTGRERMIQEENSGLTVVHPVDRIKEVVEIEKQRAVARVLKNN